QERFHRGRYDLLDLQRFGLRKSAGAVFDVDYHQAEGKDRFQSFRCPVVIFLKIFAKVYQLLNRFFMNEPRDIVKGTAPGGFEIFAGRIEQVKEAYLFEKPSEKTVLI